MRSFALSLVVLLSAYAQPAAASILVKPDQDTYTVSPGQTIAIQIFVDTAPAQDGLQGFSMGLYSEGVEMTFAPAAGAVSNASAIVLPASLAEDGSGAPALKEVSAGYAGYFGNLLLSMDPFTEGYTSTWLGTFNFTAGTQAGTYELSLGKFFPNMSNFVTSQIEDVDNSISFQKASLIVVPEPMTILLLASGVLAMGARRRRPR